MSSLPKRTAFHPLYVRAIPQVSKFTPPAFESDADEEIGGVLLAGMVVALVAYLAHRMQEAMWAQSDLERRVRSLKRAKRRLMKA